MITVTRTSLRLLSLAIGLAFTAAVYVTMHNNPRWDWSAPGVGLLPREIVTRFMDQSYRAGQAGTARAAYFAKDARDLADDPRDLADGAPVPDVVREVVGQGMTVVVIHQLGAARGLPARDVIDVFHIKDGRIASRDRYPTRFAPTAAGEAR